MIKNNSWCFDKYFDTDVCAVNEQIFDAIFVHIDINFDVKIERRDDFDAMIERVTISIQNNVFFDVAIDIANEIIENELSKIEFDWFVNNLNINVDSFDINSTNFVFDVEKNVDIDANFAIDMIFANSIVVISTNFVFDVKKIVCKTISLDVIFANSFVNFFW